VAHLVAVDELRKACIAPEEYAQSTENNQPTAALVNIEPLWVCFVGKIPKIALHVLDGFPTQF
jgi:hypothetical protein